MSFYSQPIRVYPNWVSRIVDELLRIKSVTKNGRSYEVLYKQASVREGPKMRSIMKYPGSFNGKKTYGRTRKRNGDSEATRNPKRMDWDEAGMTGMPPLALARIEIFFSIFYLITLFLYSLPLSGTLYALETSRDCVKDLSGEGAMKEVVRLRELEAECRQRAAAEPDKKWTWVAEAAKYRFQADQEIAFHFRECNITESTIPEIQLLRWPATRDRRRLLEH